MGILRSERMKYGTLVLPVDRARQFIDIIGASTKMQFEDMNARNLHRPYKKYIQRIDEMERILRFILGSSGRSVVQGARGAGSKAFGRENARERERERGGGSTSLFALRLFGHFGIGLRRSRAGLSPSAWPGRLAPPPPPPDSSSVGIGRHFELGASHPPADPLNGMSAPSAHPPNVAKVLGPGAHEDTRRACPSK